MDIFDAADGTRLAYRRVGTGSPLICLPGGPMRAGAYLGDLGGLPAHHTLILLDLRGTGGSAVPRDPATYRCDRLAADVEALRIRLGLDRVDLLGHSAGAAVALLYAVRHPDRIGRLVLLNPSPRVVGIEVTDADRREVAERRRGEPWFPDAYAAFERIWAGTPEPADWTAVTPFTYGRWDDAARADADAADGQRNDAAAAAYYPGVDVSAVRAALAGLRARVLLVAGEHDVALPPKRAAEYAGLFPHAEVAVQPRGGHSPWLDDPAWLATTVAAFLR
ncbi:alpha/beta hydrolase [Dactylosporangium aurantiacum]|uniref:Alpha/beta hydrolase n=1 Tax=Dactylosporangium aurantiacum TaxID=35754 RepID=A0A9Q9ICJ3_9ACTN|nr:alpha/beta hydrolase [Dactylosporangium aurantiacum]MDG6103589.1 alpha/beta hydrolase [Dactylosporangium aurantiacum]UWZ51918.1 alpha/beta hydrolase [Dactylosporangium aurantiacum]